MGFIRSTQLATSQSVNNFNIGFPFFPTNTTIDNPARPQRIGFDASQDLPRDILRVSIPLLFYRLRSNVSARFVAAAFFGYTLQYLVEGFGGSQGFAELRFRDDSAQGGLGFGLGFEVDVGLAVDQANIRFTWSSGFRTTWEQVFNFSRRANVDLIRIALAALKAAGFSIPLEPLEAVREMAGSGVFWGILGSTSNQLGRTGELVLTPKVSIHGDLLKGIGIVNAGFKAFLDALKRIGAKAKAGPQMNINFPMTLRIVRLTTESGRYNFVRLRPLGNGNVEHQFEGDPFPATDADVQQVTITHSHSFNVTVTFDLKAKVKLWSIFSEQVLVPIDLSSVMPTTQPSGRQFFTALSNRPVAAAEFPEVVWG